MGRCVDSTGGRRKLKGDWAEKMRVFLEIQPRFVQARYIAPAFAEFHPDFYPENKTRGKTSMVGWLLSKLCGDPYAKKSSRGAVWRNPYHREKKKIAWDIDGTIYYNFLELAFFEFVDRWGGRDAILPFNRMNPEIIPGEIEYVVTFRPEWWRGPTENECRGHGIFPKEIIMNPSGTDIHTGEAIKFKAKVLNERLFDIYVDNDILLLERLRPMLKWTQCMTVEEYRQKSRYFPKVSIEACT